MILDSFEVIGGQRLEGTIVPQGAKNETLQILCATLLTSEKVHISNIPAIRDVELLIELLRGLGVGVKKHAANSYSFQANSIDLDYFTSDDYHKNARRIRGSVMLLRPTNGMYV